jgi:ATP adenylyltransferase
MYKRLLAAAHVADGQNELAAPTNGHHNVLLSPRWMLVVPRTREGTDGLSGNGLVFAGVFFAKDQQLCDKLADIGPINFLTHITS